MVDRVGSVAQRDEHNGPPHPADGSGMMEGVPLQEGAITLILMGESLAAVAHRRVSVERWGRCFPSKGRVFSSSAIV